MVRVINDFCEVIALCDFSAPAEQAEVKSLGPKSVKAFVGERILCSLRIFFCAVDRHV